MGDLFQYGKPKEAACSLDCVNRAEDACQHRRIFGTLLQLHEFLVQTGEIFVALDEEFLNNILILHSLLSAPKRAGTQRVDPSRFLSRGRLRAGPKSLSARM